MGAKKKFKKAKKKTKKKAKKTTKDVKKDVKKTYKAAKKTVNKTTGAIDGFVDKAVDVTAGDVQNAYKYAKKKLDEAGDILESLAEEAVQAAYKNAYKKYIKDYVDMIIGLVDAQGKISGEKGKENLIKNIGNDLIAGRYSDAQSGVADLMEHKALKSVISDAHKVMGTCFVFAMDLSVGVSHSSGWGAGASGVVGVARDLRQLPFVGSLEKGDVSDAFFTVAGGSLSYSGPSAGAEVGLEMGVSMGWLKGDPLNISGVAIDVAGQITTSKGWVIGVSMGFAPWKFTKKEVKITYRPSTVLARFAYSVSTGDSEGLGGSISLGASNTWVVQKIKVGEIPFG